MVERSDTVDTYWVCEACRQRVLVVDGWGWSEMKVTQFKRRHESAGHKMRQMTEEELEEEWEAGVEYWEFP